MGKFMSIKPYKVDRNGTQYFYDYTCQRCGGNGSSEAWRYTGCICYECGGSGQSTPRTVKVYTPEYEEKLNARRLRAREKKEAKWREEAPARNAEFFAKHGLSEDGHMWVVLGNTFAIKDVLKERGCHYSPAVGWFGATEQKDNPCLMLTADEVYETDDFGRYVNFITDAARVKVAEANAALTRETDTSSYLGEVGGKIEAHVSIVGVHDYEYRVSPYSLKTVYIFTFTDDAGNIIVWKTGTWFGRDVDGRFVPYDRGDSMTIRATVKEHGVYRDRKQTVVTRVKAI